MADGNKRYLGDVFINQENYEFQDDFIRDLIESYEYRNNGEFDASTLGGFGPEYFATKEQGSKAENALQSPLLIGQLSNGHYLINVNDQNEAQYIYTDGVLLERGDGRLNAIDWYNELANDDVTDALESIFNNVINIQSNLQDDIENKADNDDFQNLKQKISNVFETFTENGEEVSKVNADLINGLRFILITQDDYDDLPLEDKQYWRNVYIIRDDIPADYEDPMTWDLSDGYIFEIRDGNVDYKHRSSTQWKTICSLEDFLEGANLSEIIKDFIEDNQNYIVNGTSLNESLQNIPSSSINPQWQEYPFLSSSLHDDFIYDLKLDGSKTYVTESVDNNSFKNIDINLNQILKNNKVLDENGENIISALSDDLSSKSTLLDEVRSALSVAQNDIRTLQNSGTDLSRIEQRLSSIESRITTANNSINTLNNRMNSLKTYTKYSGSFVNNDSNIYYNNELRIAFVQIQLNHAHKKKNNAAWIKIANLPSQFKPKQGFKAPHSPNVTVYFKYTGEIFCRIDSDSDKTFSIAAGGTFFY